MADVVDAPRHVGIKNALGMSTMFASIERTKRPVHKVCHPFEVVRFRRADDNGATCDRRIGQGTPPLDCYDFLRRSLDRISSVLSEVYYNIFEETNKTTL